MYFERVFFPTFETAAYGAAKHRYRHDRSNAKYSTRGRDRGGGGKGGKCCIPESIWPWSVHDKFVFPFHLKNG